MFTATMGFLVLAIVVLFILVIRERRMQNEAWAELAHRLGLYYDPPTLMSQRRRLEGTYKGKTVRVDVRIEGTGKSQQLFTRYRRELDERWTKQVRIRSFEKGLFKGKPKGYTTGHTGFDESFEVVGRVGREVEAVLSDAEVQRELRRLSERFTDCGVRKGALWVEHLRVSHEPLRMKRNLDRMMNLDLAIEEALDRFHNVDVGGWGDDEELFPVLDPVQQEQESTGVAW